MKSHLKVPEHLKSFSGVWNLVQQGIDQVQPTRVILFGSRATGSARPNSDFDIAFEFSNSSKNTEWNRFVSDVVESPETLYSIDWVNLSEASQDLRESIQKEGIAIYVQA